MAWRAIGVGLLAIIAGAFGWHLSLKGEVAERVESLPMLEAVDRVMPISVSVNPLTNYVEVSLEVAFAAEPENLLGRLARDVGVGLAVEHWPERIEEELARHARERSDVYAWVVPWRASVVDPRRRD